MIGKIIIFIIGLILGFLAAIYLVSAANFTIVTLPDTQTYTDFSPQTEWIVNHTEELNIKAVLHLGDIVNNYDNLTQWDQANQSVQVLRDANITFLPIAGNRDLVRINKTFNFSYENYQAYFGEINQFYLLGNGYGIVGTSYVAENFNSTIEDLHAVLNQTQTYPNVSFIYFTHRYYDEDIEGLINEELLNNATNIFMTTNGHRCCDERRYVNGTYSFLTDYQTDMEDIKAEWQFLRYYTFQDDKVNAVTFSPITNFTLTNFTFYLNDSYFAEGNISVLEKPKPKSQPTPPPPDI